MMNVLFVVQDFYPNSTGFANASYNLVESIKKYGKDQYSVSVFTTTPLGGKQELNGTDILRYNNSTFDNRITHIFNERKKYFKLKEFINEKKADIIFFETNTFPFLQYWTLKEYGSKVFVRIHSTADTEVPIFGAHESILDKIEYRLMCKYMQGVNNIVSTSNYYLDFIKKYYLNENVYSIWNNKSYGLLFNTAGEGANKRSRISNNTFMTMGKMSENGVTQKGITDLLKALFYVKKERELPDNFKLIIVGTGVKYPYIKEYVHTLGLDDCVEMIEMASHEKILELISDSKAIILLSRYEGQSMFITESLSLGKPLILSDNNGMQDMIVNGENGLVVKTGEPQSAAVAISEFLSYDDDKLGKMGEYSFTLYKKNYTDEAVYKQFDELIRLRIKGD